LSQYELISAESKALRLGLFIKNIFLFPTCSLTPGLRRPETRDTEVVFCCPVLLLPFPTAKASRPIKKKPGTLTVPSFIYYRFYVLSLFLFPTYQEKIERQRGSSCRSEAFAFVFGKLLLKSNSGFPKTTRDLKSFEERHIESVR